MGKYLKIFREYPALLDLAYFILSLFLIHSFYLFYVDPISLAELEQAAQTGTVPQRTIWLILKDFEQELALVLGFWFLLFDRYKTFNDDARLINIDFLRLKSESFSFEGLEDRMIEAEKLKLNSYILPGVRIFWDNYRVSNSVERAKKASFDFYLLREESLESKLQLVNFVLWAIPSVGFLGTVRGIGQALAEADEALSGNIATVALNLGIAFNSTFVALILSLILTFIASGLRGRDGERIINCKSYIADKLCDRLENFGSRPSSE
jgi:biopolymer transport protein ExbB/TolQ